MPTPIKAVLFDLFYTLVKAADTPAWIEAGWTSLGRPGTAREALGAADFDEAVAFIDHVWTHADVIDPKGERDRDPDVHRRVFAELLGDKTALDEELTAAMHPLIPEQIIAYTDAVPVLADLQARGVKTAALTNTGTDVAPPLERLGLGSHLDAVIQSYQVGAVKPEPELFAHALEVLGVPAAETLMVGDTWYTDAGAAALGMRVLVLPRTDTPDHGLDLVLRMIG